MAAPGHGRTLRIKVTTRVLLRSGPARHLLDLAGDGVHGAAVLPL